MNDSQKPVAVTKPEILPPEDGGNKSQGPSLTLLYSLLALMLLVATAAAALIVLPFYIHRH
ncbi:MAG TPA: hypothetical protein VFI20_13295 [Terracidiphilus sp.]|nr:hypothetical protein [Terracidiphilus sp.]